MTQYLLSLFISVCFAVDVPKTSDERYERLMGIWNDELTFDNRDNFLTHIKRVQGDKSDEGSKISVKEYDELIRLSKQKSIPEYVEYDSAGRPPQEKRTILVQETCEKFKGQPSKRCEKRWREIVDYQSEDNDDVSDKEWDDFQALVKKINSELATKVKGK